jgi:hypothetical protein
MQTRVQKVAEPESKSSVINNDSSTLQHEALSQRVSLPGIKGSGARSNYLRLQREVQLQEMGVTEKPNYLFGIQHALNNGSFASRRAAIVDSSKTFGIQFAMDRLGALQAEEDVALAKAEEEGEKDDSAFAGQGKDKHALQAKLQVGSINDKYEQEAERVARQVINMSEPDIKKQGATAEIKENASGIKRNAELEGKYEDDESNEEILLSRKASSSGLNVVNKPIESHIRNLKGSGESLPDSDRKYFEPRFDADFSNVKIHKDEKSAETAKAMHAKAYTMGNDIVFNKGEYNPETNEGKKLIAHELTHVIQQANGLQKQIQRYVAPTDWLDYIGLGVDLAERIYIELAYKAGEEKDFQRFVNTLYFIIDAILAATPGAGGGGLAFRASRKFAVAGWGALSVPIRSKITKQLAKELGWSFGKTAQMVNRYFSVGKNQGNSTGKNKSGKTKSSGAADKKLRNKLAAIANKAYSAKGKQASRLLQNMAKKAGLIVKPGGKHLKVMDSAGNMVTTIPHSPHAKGTIKSIAEAIMSSAGF